MSCGWQSSLTPAVWNAPCTDSCIREDILSEMYPVVLSYSMDCQFLVGEGDWCGWLSRRGNFAIQASDNCIFVEYCRQLLGSVFRPVIVS